MGEKIYFLISTIYKVEAKERQREMGLLGNKKNREKTFLVGLFHLHNIVWKRYDTLVLMYVYKKWYLGHL